MATCKDCFHWEACKMMCEAMRIIVCDDFQGSADRCENFVNTADVAPMAEVAREIFEEIRDLIRFTMEPNSTTLYAKIEFEKLEALKKKYTQPEPPKGD